jgi:hypothetical protein
LLPPVNYEATPVADFVPRCPCLSFPAQCFLIPAFTTFPLSTFPLSTYPPVPTSSWHYCLLTLSFLLFPSYSFLLTLSFLLFPSYSFSFTFPPLISCSNFPLGCYWLPILPRITLFASPPMAGNTNFVDDFIQSEVPSISRLATFTYCGKEKLGHLHKLLSSATTEQLKLLLAPVQSQPRQSARFKNLLRGLKKNPNQNQEDETAERLIENWISYVGVVSLSSPMKKRVKGRIERMIVTGGPGILLRVGVRTKAEFVFNYFISQTPRC